MPTSRRANLLRLSALGALALSPSFSTSLCAQPQDVDVPFVTSPPAVTQAMLEIAKVTRDDFVIDLGAGDGRIVVLAAKQFGARGLGVELDPNLVELARENATKARVSERAKFRVEDLFMTSLSAATVITMYLLPDVNLQLRQKLLGLKPGTRIVSHDWDMGDWPPDDMRVIDNPDKRVGLEKTSRVYLWTIPAQLPGKWCARQAKSFTEPAYRVTLEITQRYQKITGELRAVTDVDGTKTEALKPMAVKFRATLNGTRFAIPHPNRDANATLEGETITLDGRAYGLSEALRFTRSDTCESGNIRTVMMLESPRQ
jgi:SAM-dependent methyltransferase